jgi:hypothetical protein
MPDGFSKTVIIIEVIIASAFAVTLYFLLPYVLPIFGLRSYVVISGSMQHFPENQAFFEKFWEQKGVNPGNIPLKYGLSKNDLVITMPSDSYSIGDVVEIREPESKMISIHRIFQLNSTDMRDIGDYAIQEANMRSVLLGVKGTTIIAYEKNQTLPHDTEFSYEGGYYEIHSHYWMPVSYIKGSVMLVLPQAGLVRNILDGYGPEELK